MTPPIDMRELVRPVGSEPDPTLPVTDRRLLKALFDTVPGRAVFVDRDLHYRYVNPEFVAFIGRPEEKIIGLSVGQLLGEKVLQAYMPVLERLKTGGCFNWEGWADYGSYGSCYVQESITPYRIGDGPILGYIAVARDMTQLKLREQELAEQVIQQQAAQAYHAAVVDSALDCIVVIDEEGLVTDFNPAAEAVFGYPRAQAVGRCIAELIVPEQYRQAHTEGLASYIKTGNSRVLGRRIELEAIRADGSEIPIELAITEVSLLGKRLFAAHIRDLTESRQARAEIERQREALHQKEKLAALGSLLAGVAHELNNPLSIVLGQAMMLKDKLSSGAVGPEQLADLTQRSGKIEAAANRCARIVRSFLAMARQRKVERRPTALSRVVSEALELLSYGLRSSGIVVETSVPADLPHVLVDSDQLHQVVVNLVVNANQALEERPAAERKIRISARHDRKEGTLKLDVCDNGPGVPHAIRSRIFDPFYTTKSQGAGTGIGLAVSRGLMEANGGTIEVGDSGFASGARFTITLPVDDEEKTGAQQPDGPTRTSAAVDVREPVLVVDDEEEIAALLCDLASDLGYATISARSGEDAKTKITAQAGRITAILCDIRMPDGDGPSLYDWLTINHPRLADRICFVTGDTLGPAAGRFLARSGCPVIEKPFSPEDIRRVLASLPR